MPADNAEDIQMKQNRTTDRLVLTAALLLAAVPISLACIRIVPGSGADNTEDGPCNGAGVCDKYVSCPTGPTCSSSHRYGATVCWNITETTQCQRYVNGTPNTYGCCTDGDPRETRPGVINTVILSGRCEWWFIPVDGTPVY
jgi:hypothetical protein